MANRYIDLHSHWIAGVDDGAKNLRESEELLSALYQAGFGYVVATPHMRPGMFDNDRPRLLASYAETVQALGLSESTEAETSASVRFPRIGLGCEHYFDDVVYERLLARQGLPYPGGFAALIEFGHRAFPARVQHHLFDLKRSGIRPVLAHPERYDPVAEDPSILEPLLDVGVLLLLDVAALDGKYGRAAKRTAQKLVEDGFYYAACSDAHRASDVDHVVRGIDELTRLAGPEERDFFLHEGPANILAGTFDEP